MKGIIVAAAILLLAGCSSTPVIDNAPRADFDRGTDFRVYKTYRWFDGPFMPDDPATKEETQYQTVRDAINVQLKEKGYEWRQFSATDLVLHVHSGMISPRQPDAWITYNWYKPWWGAYGPMADISRYDPGTLVLDVIDAKRTELIWRGLLPAVYDEDGSLIQPEKLPDRIAAMLKDYPAAVK
ncbi:DUF4136 domain-containing protein [bacterium]|nr:DUF4136 domain-containing protein [bacterium]